MRITASVGSRIPASGMLSMRTSCALGMTVARILSGSCEIEILLAADELQPADGRAVQRLLGLPPLLPEPPPTIAGPCATGRGAALSRLSDHAAQAWGSRFLC